MNISNEDFSLITLEECRECIEIPLTLHVKKLQNNNKVSVDINSDILFERFCYSMYRTCYSCPIFNYCAEHDLNGLYDYCIKHNFYDCYKKWLESKVKNNENKGNT